ncbi:MAG: hypothetical protein SFV54_19270 [Bryobacteraceae bacterium]|nr:hypothetical protein [Bryobacteraceae bacterium]
MEYAIGVGLALAVCVFAMVTGYDRERVFYPTVVTVVASFYVLFAAMGGSGAVVAQESVIAAGFAGLGVIGFKKNLWVAAAALAGHGVFDFVHHLVIRNEGMPEWWPGFCGSFDVVAGVFVGVLLWRRGRFKS